MAYIEGYPGAKIKSTTAKHWGFIVIVTVMLVGIMAYLSKDWRAELPSIIFTVSIILAIVIFVFFKVNPMGWRKLLMRSSFDRMLRLDRMVADILSQLDDTHFIFHDITFELFHIENLVISPRGIFVISKIGNEGQLQIKDKSLYAGGELLDKLTGNVWRVCHLINIVIDKGFKEKIMPKPVLVVPEAGSVAVKNFEGITITTLDKLNEFIETQKDSKISQELVERFAFYIKKRYT
ncbi:MAG: hypothetical protein JW743_11510 [Deltaproteobacteria bacterium]|nr:hypothetical protein [Deltaproteobacteria bacterium]MBN2846812.1 hypothetical protein [Deltaproteobacteria bacterium]